MRDAAIIEQRVAFAGRAVADDASCLRPWRRSGTTAACAWWPSPARRSSDRSARRSKPSRQLARAAVPAPDRQYRLRTRRLRDAQRSASSRHASTAPRHRTIVRPMRREHLLDRQEREIAEVLVVDRVELVLCHQPLQMRKLHRDHALRLEQALHAGDEVVQVRHVRQHIVAEHQIGLAVLWRRSCRRCCAAVEADLACGCRAPARPWRRWRPARCPAPATPAATKCCSR